MAKLIYATNVSLDGYFEDPSGSFQWGRPDDAQFAATTSLLQSCTHLLYGRRLYETMAVWETNPALAQQSDLGATFAAAWRAPEKIVYSSTLVSVPTERTRIERQFDPEVVRRLKSESDGSLMIGGAELAAAAFVAGLVDECDLFVWPVTLGGGRSALPDAVRTHLELLDEQRFTNDVVRRRYRV